MQFDKRELLILAAILSVSFLVRVLLFAVQGFPNDLGTYGFWFNTANEQGVRSFYTYLWSNPDTAWVDYPPFNVYIFWVFGSLTKALAPYGVSWVNIVKLVPNLFDMAIGTVIYFFVRKQLSFKLSLITVALYVFNPAIVFNAAVWGQFDATYTLFLLISLLFAIKSKPEFSAVTFALAILTKAQGIALLPLVVFLILKQNGVKRFLTSVLAFTATIFAVILPLDWGGNPVTFLSRLYFGIYGHYTYTSFNAFNLWGLFGFGISDGNFFILGWALFGALSLLTLYVLNKRFKVSDEMPTLFAAFMLFFGFFMLLTRMHERYMFPAISILVLMFPFVKKTRAFYAVLTGTLFANVAYVLYWLNLYYNLGRRDEWVNLSGHPAVFLVGAINLIMLLYAIILLWDELKGRHWLKKAPELNQTQTGEVK